MAAHLGRMFSKQLVEKVSEMFAVAAFLETAVAENKWFPAVPRNLRAGALLKTALLEKVEMANEAMKTVEP